MPVLVVRIASSQRISVLGCDVELLLVADGVGDEVTDGVGDEVTDGVIEVLGSSGASSTSGHHTPLHCGQFS